MSFKYFKIILAIISKIFFISTSFASINGDCQNSSFYIENISVDLTKESINEARFQAENKAKLLGIRRLVNRLIIKKNNFFIMPGVENKTIGLVFGYEHIF